MEKDEGRADRTDVVNRADRALMVVTQNRPEIKGGLTRRNKYL